MSNSDAYLLKIVILLLIINLGFIRDLKLLYINVNARGIFFVCITYTQTCVYITCVYVYKTFIIKYS